MLANLKMQDEEGRIAALKRLEILDTSREIPFDKIVKLIQQICRVPMCAVSLVDRHRQWFKAQCGIDVNETSRDVSFCSHAIQSATPFVVKNALLDRRFAENPLVIGPPHIRSYAGVPLMTPEGYNVGALCVIDVVPRDFSKEEIDILENFAKVVVNEFELRLIASSDYLTGALTRRAWNEKANSEFARSQRYGRPLSVAIIDIDKFKSVNDAFGHGAGDIVIQSLANLCLSTKRNSDLFGRLGGEEFGILMPETNTQEARIFLERFRSLFRISPINIGKSSINSSVSIGIAQMEMNEADFSSLISRADKALYMAKNRGRNQVLIYSPIQERDPVID